MPSVHPVPHGRGGVGIDDLLDLLAVVDYNEVQLHVAGEGVQQGSSRAVRVYGICAGARRPLDWWRRAVKDYVVDLRDAAPAVVGLHDDATKRKPGCEEGSVEKETVAAVECVIRAAIAALFNCGRSLRDGGAPDCRESDEQQNSGLSPA